MQLFPEIEFPIYDGKIHFEIPSDRELEADVRATLKKDTAKEDKARFFKRGVTDAVLAFLNGRPRKFGPKEQPPVTDTENVISQFNEMHQKIFGCSPKFEVFRFGGSDHEPLLKVILTCHDGVIFDITAKNQKIGKQVVCKQAIEFYNHQ